MIDSYEFGRIVISGKTYEHDLIILPDKITENWWRRKGHELCCADLKSVLDELPPTLIIGTGESGMMKVLDEVKEELRSRGIETIIAKTKKACEEYNKIHKTRQAAIALHLTC